MLDTVNVISKGGYSQIEAINLLSGELNSNFYAFTSNCQKQYPDMDLLRNFKNYTNKWFKSYCFL